MEDFFRYPLFRNQHRVMMQLKARIKEDVTLIPTVMVKAALLSTKIRLLKLVKCQGEAFKGKICKINRKLRIKQTSVLFCKYLLNENFGFYQI